MRTVLPPPLWWGEPRTFSTCALHILWDWPRTWSTSTPRPRPDRLSGVSGCFRCYAQDTVFWVMLSFFCFNFLLFNIGKQQWSVIEKSLKLDLKYALCNTPALGYWAGHLFVLLAGLYANYWCPQPSGPRRTVVSRPLETSKRSAPENQMTELSIGGASWNAVKERNWKWDGI